MSLRLPNYRGARVAAALLLGLPLCGLAIPGAGAQERREDAAASARVREQYVKHEYRIPMRDGVHLFTAVYAPRDTARTYPMLLMRTPYSVAPYGEDHYPRALGLNRHLQDAGYIFVQQDVRGCFMSEGRFVDMRPHIDKKTSKTDVDESSDTYDTIQWLLANVPNHNGQVGQWGISYPGFYTSAGMIDAHPALKASSPQAPIADWFFDDFHHHGAFFLPHAFNFMAVFGQSRPQPTTLWPNRFEHHTPDGYEFFMNLGALKHANERYLKDRVPFWNRMAEHPNYDSFWQARNLLPHLKHVAPAVLTVGGWFDAEDLYGALKTFRAVDRQNPGVAGTLVMGPWRHGGWSRGAGTRLGNIHFGARTSEFYQKEIEFPFFEHYLKGNKDPGLPRAYVFETGVNRWRQFAQWPPRDLKSKNLYFRADGKLSWDAPDDAADVHDDYVSDPARPVPFTEVIADGMTAEYMTDDQRFAARRPDVLVYQTPALTEPTTLAGPLHAKLHVSTSGSDADWIVKLIDVFPDEAKDFPGMTSGEHLGAYQMMVRSEVIRGRFRKSYEHPVPFTPDQVDDVNLELQDVLHTFQPGHRIMVQIQSTWFPLVDRNPQKYVPNIYQADDKDFIKATERVYRSRAHPSCLQVGVLPE